MSLWTRTILLLAFAILSLSLGIGLDRSASTAPGDLDNFVAARNFRRAIAYRVVDYQGGRVAKPDVGSSWNPTDEAEEEEYPGAKIDHRRSLIAMERHEQNLAQAAVTSKLNELENGKDGAAGIGELKNNIAGFNNQRREVVSKFSTLENKMRLFAMTLDGYSYMLQSFQQRIFNLDYEVHLAVIERDALRAEKAQVEAYHGDIVADRIVVEDKNYESSRDLSRTAMLIKEYETRDPHLRGKADRLGNPWVRGLVVRASEDARTGLVWLSIGEQDGVQLGQVLSIHRRGQFIGRMRIESVERNSAQGRLLEEYRGRTAPMQGDQVRGARNFGEWEK